MAITRLPSTPTTRRRIGAAPVRRPAPPDSPQPWFARYTQGTVGEGRLTGPKRVRSGEQPKHYPLPTRAPQQASPELQQRMFGIPATSTLYQPTSAGGYGLSPGPYSFWGSTFGPGTEPLTAIMSGIQSIAVANPDIDVWSLIADYPVDIGNPTSVVNASRALMNDALAQALGDPERAVMYALNKIGSLVNAQKASTEAAAETYGLTAEDVTQLFSNLFQQYVGGGGATATPEPEQEPGGPVLLPSYTQTQYGFWPT